MDIFTTMITPYTADGKVDYDTAIQYVNWYFKAFSLSVSPVRSFGFPWRNA